MESILEHALIDGEELFRFSKHPEHVFEDSGTALKWASDNNINVKPLSIPEIEKE